MTDKVAGPDGSALSEGLGPADPERAEFERWFEQRRLATWRAQGCHKDRGPTPSQCWAKGLEPELWEGWKAGSAARREKCAKLAEEARFTGNSFPVTQMEQLRLDIAAAIRGA